MLSSHVMTLVNGIIGVSVLLMPYCFKQCGIILGTLMLLAGAAITRLSCYFLLKAASTSRRRTYELLAYQSFGPLAKLLSEISIVGYLLGTLTAFLVVITDLVSEYINVTQHDDSLRPLIMSFLAVFIVIPLGLLKNINSLAQLSALSIIFYTILVFKLLSEGIGPLFSGSFVDKIDYWKPSGILSSLPIFALSLSCQTQIFSLQEELQEPSIHHMNEIIKNAITYCTILYFIVGFVGYIAFSEVGLGGNILLSLSVGLSSQIIKFCFLLTLAFSFPILIFPARNSLNSLIFRRSPTHHLVHDISVNFIPEIRFRLLTVLIVGFTLIMGLLLPNIEFVLGIVGSTMGSIICIIFPSIMFIKVMQKSTTERLLAQIVFCIGVCIMVLSTYVTLYNVDQAQSHPQNQNEIINNHRHEYEPLRVTEILNNIKQGIEEKEFKIKDTNKQFNLPNQVLFTKDDSISKNKLKKIEIMKIDDEKIVDTKVDQANEANEVPKEKQQNEVKYEIDKNSQDENVNENKMNPKEMNRKVKNENLDQNIEHPAPVLINVVIQKTQDIEKVKHENEILKPQIQVDQKIKENNENNENQIESKNDNKDKSKSNVLIDKEEAQNILHKLEQHQIEQKKLIQEQKSILEELKQHQINDEKNEVPVPIPIVEDKNNAQVQNNQNQNDLNRKNNDQNQNNIVKENIEIINQEKIKKDSQPPPPVEIIDLEKDKENVKITHNENSIKLNQDGKDKDIADIKSNNNVPLDKDKVDNLVVQQKQEIKVVSPKEIDQVIQNPIENNKNQVVIPDSDQIVPELPEVKKKEM